MESMSFLIGKYVQIIGKPWKVSLTIWKEEEIVQIY